MIFTREDILKILNALLQLGRKDSELKDANTPLNSNDEIAILQDRINKKVSINNLLSSLGLLKKDDFINVSDRYDEYYIQLSEAITIVANNKRKKGLVITFLDLKGNWKIFQFDGELNNFSNTDYWKDLIDFKYPIVNSILPDEEDLTLALPNKDNNSFIKLKDKEYDVTNFSGKGTKILRKNIIEITLNDGTTKRINYLSPDIFNSENTIYEIRYDFDLNGQEIIIPEGCVLKFKGGKLINGSIIYNNTIISGEYTKNIKTVCKGKVLGYANVFMYGASGNGIDDDTLALNNAVQSGCSTMHIPAGNYLISYYIIPTDNINIYGDGDATIITNTVNYGWGKGAFLIGCMSSRTNYPSQYSIDVYNCTIGEDFAEVEDGTYDVGDIVILRDTTLMSEDTFKALYANRIVKKEGNKLYFERKLNNPFLFEASTVVIGNVSKLRASSPEGDTNWIMTPYWPYEENTFHVAYNVTISNLSIDEKYPYTGSGMYGIFINGYECSVQNVKMLNVTSPFGSNFSAFCSYKNITAYYSGGISDMAELQIENIFDDIIFLSKGKHSIHYGESFTLGNGYSNTLSRIIINGPRGVGNINFKLNPNCSIINSQLYNIYRPSLGNSAISGAEYGNTTIMNCYIRNKKTGVTGQGGFIQVIGCVFDTEDNAIGGAGPSSSKYTVISCISSKALYTDNPTLGNLFGKLKPIVKVNVLQIGVMATKSQTLFNEYTNIQYGTYAELESSFKYYNISINITIGDISNSVELTSDNTVKYVKLRLIRIKTAGIRLMLYVDNVLTNDIASFIASEDVSILPFTISVTNNDSSHQAFIYRPILTIHN